MLSNQTSKIFVDSHGFNASQAMGAIRVSTDCGMRVLPGVPLCAAFFRCDNQAAPT